MIRVRALAAVGLAVTFGVGAGCSSGGGEPAPVEEAAAPTGPNAPGVFTVVDLTPEEVHRISVESKGTQVALVRSTAATWLAEPGTSELVSGLMAERETEVLPLYAYRRLDADPQQPDFGLLDPEFVVRVQDASGAEQTISVGAATFSEAGYYASRGDDRHVYLLVRRSVDDLRSLVRGERVNSPRSRARERDPQREPRRRSRGGDQPVARPGPRGGPAMTMALRLAAHRRCGRGPQPQPPGPAGAGPMTRRGMARRLVVALAVVLSVGAAGCGGGDDGPPDVAATVAGTDIDSERVERLTTQWVESESSQAIAAEKNAPIERKAATKLVLGFVIRSQFLQHLAAQMGIEDNPSALEAVVPGEVPAAEFEAAGWSQADLEQSLRDARISKAIGEKVFPKVAVSEVELRQKFDRSAAFFNQTWQSQVRMAFFDAEAPARTLQQRAVAGDAFEAAARELGARQAGSIGVVNPVTPLPAPVLDAVAGLQTGQTSDPIPGGGGFMVLVADSREERAAMTFDQAKPELTKVLEDEARQRQFFEWFNKQLRDAEVEIDGYYGTWDPASQLVT